MYKICQTEASLNRQQHIGHSLLELMKKHPYSKISISALCHRAEIPRNVFYRYFDTKEDVIDALIDNTQILYLSQGPAGKSIFDEVERMFTFWYEHRELLDVLSKNDMIGRWLARMTAIAVKEKVGLRYAQQKENSLQYEVMTTFTISGLLSCVMYCHTMEWKQSPREMAGIVSRLLGCPLYDIS